MIWLLVENSPYACVDGSTVYYGPNSGSFTLTLTAADPDPSTGSGQAKSGLDFYEVAYRVDDGEWQPLYTGTDTSQVFAGEPGHVYTFRIRATDRVSNTSAWAQAEARTVVVKKYYSVPSAGSGQAAGQRVAMRSNGVVHYIHGDHLGSTSLTTGESGNVVAEQKYLPYGEVRWVTGTLPTDFTYTGQRSENGLGLLDYRARFYSSRLGRFVSADTLVPGVGSAYLNRYMYTNGNPVRYNDPTGHCGNDSRLSGVCFDGIKAASDDIRLDNWYFQKAMRTITDQLVSEDLTPHSTPRRSKSDDDDVIPPIKNSAYTNLGYDFGQTHPGQDYATVDGQSTYVWSAADGRVVKIGIDIPTGKDQKGYGYYAVIESTIDGETSYDLYAHIAPGSFEHYGIKVGSKISKGSFIGILCLGSGAECGTTDGTHLHFEIRKAKGYNPWVTWTELTRDVDRKLVDDYFYKPDKFIEEHYKNL